MTNIRIKASLEKLDAEINRVGQHAANYSGIAAKDAVTVIRLCEDIITTASQIRELAKHPV